MVVEKPQPIMLYDGDCDFCRYWVAKWRKKTEGVIRYRPYQRALDDFPQVSRKQCETAVQLVMADGKVYSGVNAVLKAFALAGRYLRLLKFYEKMPIVAWFCEFLYRWVSRHRDFLSKISRYWVSERKM